MAGLPFLATALYMTLVVTFVMTLLELNFQRGLWRHTLRRWGKFLLGLAILGGAVQLLTWIAG